MSFLMSFLMIQVIFQMNELLKKFTNSKIEEKRVGRSLQEKLGRTSSRIVMLDIQPTI